MAQDIPYSLDRPVEEAYESITNQQNQNFTAFLGPEGFTLLKALEFGLAHNSDILSYRLDLEATRGAVQSIKGAYDPTLSVSANTAHDRSPFEDIEAEILGYRSSYSISDQASLSLSKLFTTGTTLGATADLSRYEDRRTEQPDSNAAGLRIGISQPLLRGFGDGIADADLKTAKMDYEAARAEEIFNISSTANQIIQNFWVYADTREGLICYEASLARLREIAAAFDDLSRRGVLKPEEKSLIEANISQAQSTLLTIDDLIRSAKDSLGISIGVDDAQRDQIPLPEYELRMPISLTKQDLARYIAHAMENRGDMQAQKTRVDSGEVRKEKAEDDLLPSLNVSAMALHQRISEGGNFGDTFSTLYEGNDANSWSAGMTLSYPLGNNAAKGALAQNRASLLQQKLRVHDLRRSIAYGINQSYEQLESQLKQIVQTRTTFENYQSSYKDKFAQFQSGGLSLYDLLQAETDLTNAELSFAGTLIRYYQQLVAFRYETGTLLAPRGDHELVFPANRLFSASFDVGPSGQ